MNSSNDQGPRVRAAAGKAVLALPATILMPFVMVWRSPKGIWDDRASRGILITAGLLLVAGTVIFGTGE